MRALLAVASALLLTACGSLQRHTPMTAVAPKLKVIGYAMGRVDFSRVHAEKLTHINYAFGLVSTNGEAFLRTNAPPHLAQLQALKARNPNLKVILSIGGWGADNFSDAALTDDSRQKFARSCVNLLKSYALDGIDLDWEYPGQLGPGIKYREDDKTNFTAMLRELRAQLDVLSDERKRIGADRYTLTIATAGGAYFKHTEMEKVHAYVDWINIMTYDFYGISTPAGHHATLFTPASTYYRRTSDSDVKDHLNAGIPSNKLVIGAAFYGKAWNNVTSIEPINEGKYVRSYSYSQLKREILPSSAYERRWDATAKADYLWNPATSTFISYEGPAALKAKCDYIKQNKLAGVMFWEYSNDPEEHLLDVLTRELN
jgi:chitinase